MRAGTAIGLLLIVVGAILFAPRLGRKKAPGLPAPIPSRPEREAAVPLYDLRPLLALVPADDLLETYPDEAWRKLDAMRRNERKHATAEEYERVVGWLTTTREHARRLGEEERYRQEWQIRTNFRMDPFLRDHRFVVVRRPPWLVFVEAGEGAREEGERAARHLVNMTDEIHRRLGKPFDFPAFAELPGPGAGIQTIIFFRSEKTLRAHIRSKGRHLGPWDDSWYRGKVEGCLSFRRHRREGTGAWARRFLLPAAHQSLDLLRQHALAQADPDRGRHRMRSDGVFCVRQGLAWMFSAVDEQGQVPSLRKDCLRVIRDGDWTMPFPVFLKIATREDLSRKAFDIALNRMELRKVESAYIARAWAFVHFLWHHEEGKYRERLLSYLREEMRGRGGYYWWAKAWAPVCLDWTPLEKEFEAWLADTCERAGVK